jgi:SAM-dependent methyltransferase
MDDLKQTYDRIASDWDRDHKDDAWWKEEIEQYLRFVPAGGSILDLGCGPGHKSAFFASRGFAVTGVDLSSEMIALAKRDVPEATFEVLDMYELPLIGKSFDSVFACASLLHIPKKDTLHILLSIAAVLASGGTCYVSVKALRDGEADETVATENDYGYEYSRFFSYFTAAELHDLFVRARLTPVFEAVTTAGKTNWLVIVGKKA